MHKSSKTTYIWRKVEKAKTTYIRDRKEYKSRNIKTSFFLFWIEAYPELWIWAEIRRKSLKFGPTAGVR